MNSHQITDHIKKHIQDAQVNVKDLTGGGDHWEIQVISSAFSGKSLIERHRQMHSIMDGPMKEDVHAVKFKTLTPQEWQAKNQRS